MPIGNSLTVTDFGGVVQKARKSTASPPIVGGIGQADCPDGAALSALSSGWNKKLSGVSGDQLTKVKNKAPPKISDGQ
ncbi:MAG: hypothetical protein WBX00_35490 [Isosphaeraceae bacterium]